jgi:hypothetical protein
VVEKRVLRRIFGLKRDEVIGRWTILHSEGLHNLYTSPGIIRMMKSRKVRWTGHVTYMGENRSANRILEGKLEGRIPLGRPERRWDDNVLTCRHIARQRLGKHISATTNTQATI